LFNFVLAFSENGICHSFNAKHPSKMLKKTQYMDAFKKVFGNEPEEEFSPYNISGLYHNLKIAFL
jgi:hypothetical protein